MTIIYNVNVVACIVIIIMMSGYLGFYIILFLLSWNKNSEKFIDYIGKKLFCVLVASANMYLTYFS